MAHDLSCLHTAGLRSVQDSFGQAALLAPSVLASKVGTGSNPLDNGQSVQTWKLQPLQPEGEYASRRRAAQIGSRQEATSVSLCSASSMCVFVCAKLC